MPQLLILALLIALPASIAWGIYLWQKSVYEHTEYFTATRKPYRAARKDLGAWGEYLTYCKLGAIPGYKKFLFNCYIPKEDGTFSEADLILLHPSGVYVFESKNYSGWIFGNEADRQWTQSLNGRHKKRFYSPLMQNNSHIRQLLRFAPELAREAIQSVIVFSERCDLRKITLTSQQHLVVKRHRLLFAMEPLIRRQLLSPADIDTLYQRLFPQTQLTEQQKQAHIQHVKDIAEHRICPYCGNPLVVKTARKTGKQFWGCSKYPSCKYTAEF